MNRHARRAKEKQMAGKRYVAKCAMCTAATCTIHVLERRAIYADDPTAPKDLGICEGCPCALGLCDTCGETGRHWLGCRAVGLQEKPEKGIMIQ